MRNETNLGIWKTLFQHLSGGNNHYHEKPHSLWPVQGQIHKSRSPELEERVLTTRSCRLIIVIPIIIIVTIIIIIIIIIIITTTIIPMIGIAQSVKTRTYYKPNDWGSISEITLLTHIEKFLLFTAA
jgi:hypothetical protein